MERKPKRDEFGRFIGVNRIDYKEALRDRFAESAMISIISSKPDWPSSYIAKKAWEIAYEMMRFR